MAPMSQEQFLKAKLKMRDRFARLILWKLGEMYEKYAARPRTQRAAKDLRAAADARASRKAKARRAPRGTPARKPRSPAGRETRDRDQEPLK